MRLTVELTEGGTAIPMGLEPGVETLKMSVTEGGGTATGDKTYVHNQRQASREWTVTHNLNKMPSVTVVDSAGTQVIGDVLYLDSNRVMLRFSGAFAGKAYCN